MPKPITKSLFVDYLTFPKLAWRKVNHPDTYKKIRKLESEEQAEQIIQLGQEVEDAVWQYLETKHGATPINLFPDIPKPESTTEDEEGEDSWIYETDVRNPALQGREQKITQACKQTLEAITRKEKILYQPSFQIDNCFVRADFMVLNDQGKYDLIEVKAKSGIRKTVTDGKDKKKIGPIEDAFIHDVSFQQWVIDQVLTSRGLGQLEHIFLYYLNKDYIKNGPLDIYALIQEDQANTSHEIEVEQRGKDKKIVVEDRLMDSISIQQYVSKISEEMQLSEEAINKIHQFPGNKYLEYFGEDKPFGSVMSIPKLHFSKAPIVADLYYQGKRDIASLSEEDKDLFNSKDSRGGARTFIENYLHCKATGESIIDKSSIATILDGFDYPICFYDYESINVPIPYMDHTHPYQQVVVQYSLHKYYPDPADPRGGAATMKHYGGVLGSLAETPQVEQITIPHNANAVDFESEKVVHGSYKDLLQEFLKDIGEDLTTSTFVVRYKPFENTRNKEIGKIFPDLLDVFGCINDRTFDLMDIFSQNYYFDLAFKGSNSIKKVLPALVPSMSYDGMDIGKGDIAMRALNELLDPNNRTLQGEERQKTIEDLLLYCGQDSLAMVRIYEVLKNL